MATEPGVTVYVASANTRWATELCIRTIYQFAGHPFELVVGDCGSTDGSLEMLQDFERRGCLQLSVAPGGRKHADWLDAWLAECTTHWALFVDSDVEFLRVGWLSDTLATAAATGSALICQYLSPSYSDYVSPINGVHLSLAERPSPWFLLLDVATARQTKASFAGTQLSDPVTGETISYDVGARFFHELRGRGHDAVQLPSSVAAKIRHYGGLSWLPGGKGVNRHQEAGGAPIGRYPLKVRNARVAASQFKKMATIRIHLQRVRRRQDNALTTT